MPEPEKCPKCNKPLWSVIPEEVGNTIEWNEDGGYYEADRAQTQITYYCGECKKPIGGWRADGEQWGITPEFQ